MSWVQYVKYNAKLRKYPQRIVEEMKGNGYVTTIHCIVSGVIKLSKVWSLPPGQLAAPPLPVPSSLLRAGTAANTWRGSDADTVAHCQSATF